ncbi:MAG: sigma-54 dependent transcriptional regulator [Halofilum sp. (in: g-proteobacteria)]|nr:sigma-54 dependent transcriptional regulator [Halofilum sp. (in: g-proteobacteria)]
MRKPMSENAAGETEAKPGLLLVDDDQLIRDSLSYMLRPDFEVHLAETRREANEILQQLSPAPVLALVDLGLPPYPHRPDEGFALVPELLAHNPRMRVLALSGQDEPANLRHAFALGAADFIAKPCEPELLKSRLNHQMMLLHAEEEVEEEQHEVVLFGESPALEALREQITQFADAPFPVLIEGESGTGKELIARQLHDASQHASRPFLAVNCAAFTETLLEAQLFGHAKGAFTGATQARAGFFEEAGDGTLFLDEIGEMPLELQSRLLRVIESGEYYRVGETRPRQATARLVTATNKDLMAEVEAHRFRQDLYYRLGILPIHVPPLRERGDDRLRLLEHFQQVYTGTVPPFTLDEGAQRDWMEYPFPGNVRELRNIVIRLGTKYPGQTIDAECLAAELDPTARGQATGPAAYGIMPDIHAARARLQQGDFDLDAYLEAVEWRLIEAAQDLSEGNLSRAAQLLNVNRTTLYSKIERLRERQL